MEEKSISDVIEDYLKQILGNSAQIEIRRAEIANHFDVVPSQINYAVSYTHLDVYKRQRQPKISKLRPKTKGRCIFNHPWFFLFKNDRGGVRIVLVSFETERISEV